ncbi:50S ribosomal protein L16 [Candidatus Parcubacteria bacterium]|nr:50S ribosomal protein L16 [Candidatus Parcubacteria bacterium]
MLLPKKVKFRKWHTFRKHPDKVGVATRGIELAFGSFGLKAITGHRIRSNQIESARKVVSRSLGKTGKVWIRIFPDMPYTMKPAEVKMGKGKGDPQGYQVPVKPGRILFEVDGVEESVAREALRKAGTKLPVKTRVVSRIH